jgi:hypothetical protein
VPAGITSVNLGLIWYYNGVAGDVFTLEAIELHDFVPSSSLGYKYISTDADGKNRWVRMIRMEISCR